MATCSPQALLTAGIGFEQLVNENDACAVTIQLLSQIEGDGLTRQQLLDAAAPFRWLEPSMAKAVTIQLLCNWSAL